GVGPAVPAATRVPCQAFLLASNVFNGPRALRPAQPALRVIGLADSIEAWGMQCAAAHQARSARLPARRPGLRRPHYGKPGVPAGTRADCDEYAMRGLRPAQPALRVIGVGGQDQRYLRAARLAVGELDGAAEVAGEAAHHGEAETGPALASAEEG